MSGEPEEAGSHPALAGERELVRVEITKTRGLGIAVALADHEAHDRPVGVFGRQDDHPGAERRVGDCDEQGRIDVEGQIHELGVALAVGECVDIAIRYGVQLAGDQAHVLTHH